TGGVRPLPVPPRARRDLPRDLRAAAGPGGRGLPVRGGPPGGLPLGRDRPPEAREARGIRRPADRPKTPPQWRRRPAVPHDERLELTLRLLPPPLVFLEELADVARELELAV